MNIKVIIGLIAVLLLTSSCSSVSGNSVDAIELELISLKDRIEFLEDTGMPEAFTTNSNEL